MISPIGGWDALELLLRQVWRPLVLGLLLVLLAFLLGGCGGLPAPASPPPSDAGAGEVGHEASPLGETCGAEGIARCVSGTTYACWPVESSDGGVNRAELRWTGLSECAAGVPPAGSCELADRRLFCVQGRAFMCWRPASQDDGGTWGRWTALDPYWFRCTW